MVGTIVRSAVKCAIVELGIRCIGSPTPSKQINEKAQAQANKRAAKQAVKREATKALRLALKTDPLMKQAGVTLQHRRGSRFGIVQGLGDYSWNAEGGVARHIPGTSVDSTIGRLARSLGGSLGGENWSNVGGTVGNWFSHVLGFGDYAVNSNSVLSGLNGDPVPVMHSEADSVVIRHREFIGDIQSSTAFTNTAYAINPGNSKLFPWLAPIAANFRMWRLRGCLMEFKSTSAQALAAANPAMGVVMMSTNYNVYDPPFTNKIMIDNNVFTTSGRPMDTFVHPVECAPAASPVKWYYTRVNEVPTGQDARLYDLGLFQIATVGSQSVATVGEFWMTYEIELSKPIMYGGLGVDTPSYEAIRIETGMGAAAYGMPTYAITTGNTTVFNNSAGISWDITTSKMVLPRGLQGYYLMQVINESSVSCTYASGFTATTNVTAIKLFNSTTAAHDDSTCNSGTTGAGVPMIMQFAVKLTDPSLPGVITVPTVTTSGNFTQHTFFIQLPYNLGTVVEGGKPLTKPLYQLIGGAPQLKSTYSYADALKYGRVNYETEEKIPETQSDESAYGEIQEIVNCPRPQMSMVTNSLRALGLSKSTLDIPALKRS